MGDCGGIWSWIVSTWQARYWISVPGRLRCIESIHTFVELSNCAEFTYWTSLDVVTHSNLVTVKSFFAIRTMNVLNDTKRIIEDVLVS